MKLAKTTALLLAVFMGAAIAADAFAHGGYRHGGHSHGRFAFGLSIGAPAFWYPPPYYYYPSYYPSYYYPRTVVVPAEAPAYVERGPAPGQGPLQPGYWYYCRESNAYYPHVNECAGQWEQVAPRPPSQ